jgi:cell division protein FtsB
VCRSVRGQPRSGRRRAAHAERRHVAERRRQPPIAVRKRRARRLSAVLLVLLAGYLYIGPARSYLDARARTAQDRQQLSQLMQQQADLRSRLQALRSPGAIEALARADGYVYPGETPLSAHVAQNP